MCLYNKMQCKTHFLSELLKHAWMSLCLKTVDLKIDTPAAAAATAAAAAAAPPPPPAAPPRPARVLTF